MLEITRKQAVDLLTALDYTGAKKYDQERMQNKLNEISIEGVDEDVTTNNADLDDLLDDLIDASGDFQLKWTRAKKKTVAKKKTTAEKKTTAVEDAPAEKPKKKAAPKKAGRRIARATIITRALLSVKKKKFTVDDIYAKVTEIGEKNGLTENDRETKAVWNTIKHALVEAGIVTIDGDTIQIV